MEKKIRFFVCELAAIDVATMKSSRRAVMNFHRSLVFTTRERKKCTHENVSEFEIERIPIVICKRE